LDIFSRKFQSVSEELLSDFQKKIMLQIAKHIQASTQTDLDKFLTIFQVKFRIFLRKFQNFPILKKKIQIEHRKRHLLPKFKPSSIFTKISKLILIFFDS
jgi:hypothetical protein